MLRAPLCFHIPNLVKHDPCFRPHPQTRRRRAFRGGCFRPHGNGGCVFARSFFSFHSGSCACAESLLFSPAGSARPLFSPAPRRRPVFAGVFSPACKPRGCFRPQAFLSMPIRRLRESGRAVFSPAGIDQSLFPPAPRSRRALEHSRRPSHRGERARFFRRLSRRSRAGISGMLASRLCTASEPGVYFQSHEGGGGAVS